MFSITGPKGSGKTTLMALVFEALADKGLLSAIDTKQITDNPIRYTAGNLIFDTPQCEQYEIEICPAALTQHINEGNTK